MTDGRTEAATKALCDKYAQDEELRGAAWLAISRSDAETALAGADAWDWDHGIIRTDRRTPDDAVIGYRVRVDGSEYLLYPSDVDLVRPAAVGALQGEASDA